MIAQLRSEGNLDGNAEHAIAIAFIISLTLTILGLKYGQSLLLGVGCTEEVLPLAWSYLKISCYGLSFMVFSMFFRSILSGEGDMKLPMIIAGLGTVLNIILDPIFIFSLGFGVSKSMHISVFGCVIFLHQNLYSLIS